MAFYWAFSGWIMSAICPDCGSAEENAETGEHLRLSQTLQNVSNIYLNS